MDTKNRSELFAERLVLLRQERDISRQQLANDLGVSRASLEFYEKGQRRPDIEVLAKIAEYFQVTTDYLLGFSNVKTTDAELNAVCAYTGLQERTVHDLHFSILQEKYDREHYPNYVHPWPYDTMHTLIDHMVFWGKSSDFEIALGEIIKLCKQEVEKFPEMIRTLKAYINEIQSFEGNSDEWYKFEGAIIDRYSELTSIIRNNDKFRNANYYVLQQQLIKIVDFILDDLSYVELREEFNEVERSYHSAFKDAMCKYM